MNSVKLKIDLTNADQVAAMAAFFNTLNGTQAVAAPVLTKAPEHKTEAERIAPLKKVVDELIPKDSTKQEGSTEDIEPTIEDRGLSFSELKAKFPDTRAKSKDKFLEKLGIAPAEDDDAETTEEIEPTIEDRELSFFELKAKFPDVWAKSKDKLLEKLGIAPAEDDDEETTEENTLTLMDVKMALGKKVKISPERDEDQVRANKTEAKNFLKSKGAGNTSGLDAKHYSAFVELIENLD